MSSQTLDYAKAEAFAGHMLDVLNHAALAQMASIGHQIGLFDIMADLPPSTDKRIAEVAGLNQRYVREWLGAMVTGLVIDYDPENATYSLPPCRHADPKRRPRQSGSPGAVHSPVGASRGIHPRAFPQWRRLALLCLPTISSTDGGRQRSHS